MSQDSKAQQQQAKQNSSGKDRNPGVQDKRLNGPNRPST
ncbi:spore protein [Paenibacillus sp. 481]|nr:spore protein [Paenibacillus sp. 481]UHA74927.1 spore protein [Paenibacillus sp. 481]